MTAAMKRLLNSAKMWARTTKGGAFEVWYRAVIATKESEEREAAAKELQRKVLRRLEAAAKQWLRASKGGKLLQTSVIAPKPLASFGCIAVLNRRLAAMEGFHSQGAFGAGAVCRQNPRGVREGNAIHAVLGPVEVLRVPLLHGSATLKLKKNESKHW